MKRITGVEWKEALISAANNIENKKNAINALNVFPVPDGDTGTNMASTIMNAKTEIMKVDTNNIGELAGVISHAMLLGARGNSGVILSQIFKGFTIGLKNKESVSPIELIQCFLEATKSAYGAVLKPIEGTILTVIRETSEGLLKQISINHTFEDVFALATKLARESCDNTPKLLKVLREVGVTDSGGEGLYAIIEGFYAYFKGKPIELSTSEVTIDKFISDKEVFSGEFGYCTEFLLELEKPKKFNKEYLTSRLEKIGGSMVVIVDESILKVHIHTQRPGDVLNIVTPMGQFIKIKIDNMTLQANDSKENSMKLSNNTEDVKKNVQTKPCGLISCNSGQGLINQIKTFDVDYIVEGGQTNNPSIKDIVDAINSVDAKTVFILPNNSNITLSAQQAATIVRNKKVIIIPTKSQAQTLPLVAMFSSENSEKDNKLLLNETIKTLKYGEIAPSIKDTKLNGIKIKKNDYMVMSNNKLIGTATTYNEAAIALINDIVDENSEEIIIVYGQTASKADALELKSYIEMNFDIVVQIHSGEQNIYPYYISVQ